MSLLSNFFRWLTRRRKTVSDIMSPLTKIGDELKTHAEAERVRQNEQLEKARAAQTEAELASVQASVADSHARALNSLFAPNAQN